MDYVFMTDASCDLTQKQVDEIGVEVIPMEFQMEDKCYLHYPDARMMSLDEFYSKIKSGVDSKTTQINYDTFTNYFEPYLKAGKDVIYTGIPTGLSGTYNTCMIAVNALKEKYPDRVIRTFDTKSISLGAGFQVRLAAEKYNAGAAMDELEAYLTEVRAHTVVYFVVDDLIYLKRGGRISALTAAFGKLLGIKPLITVKEDGSLESVGKIKGSKKVVSEFISLMHKHEADVKGHRIEILQADCPEAGDSLVAALKGEFGDDIAIDYQIVGPVIASHCGPGTLGIIFYGNK